MAKPSLIKLTALFLQVKNSAMKLSGFNVFENSGKNFQLNHRWPKRNMGLWWRNMRVCMGKIEFQT